MITYLIMSNIKNVRLKSLVCSLHYNSNNVYFNYINTIASMLFI